jgi:hypothetical protein
VDKLLHLDADIWVLEMLLERGWVLLGLLEDAIHDWVLQDADDLSGGLVIVGP